jgi:hypothetical protein
MGNGALAIGPKLPRPSSTLPEQPSAVQAFCVAQSLFNHLVHEREQRRPHYNAVGKLDCTAVEQRAATDNERISPSSHNVSNGCIDLANGVDCEGSTVSSSKIAPRSVRLFIASSQYFARFRVD